MAAQRRASPLSTALYRLELLPCLHLTPSGSLAPDSQRHLVVPERVPVLNREVVRNVWEETGDR